MSNHDNTDNKRRTVLKSLGVSTVALAGASAPTAAHPHGKGKGKGNGNAQSDDGPEDEVEQEEQPGHGYGNWCCSCGFAPQGRRRGPGYRRGYPHERDDTEWDDWEPGDGRPPWARGDGDDDSEDDDEESPEEDDNGDEDTPETGEPDNSDDDTGDDTEDTDDDSETETPEDDDTESEDPTEDEDEQGDTDAPDESTEGDDTVDEDEPTDEDDTPPDGSEEPTEEPGTETPEAPDEDTDEESPEDADIATQIEQRIHALINDYRAEQDAPELAFGDELATVAREHSEDMAQEGYFSHVSPDGDGPGERLEDAGIDCYAWAENIAWESGPDVTEDDVESIANSTASGWINSSGHRENILGNYDSEGIGVYVEGGDVYATQVFCSSE